MITYLLLGVLLLGAIVPSFAPPLSLLRLLRFLFVFAVYPLFVAIAVLDGLEVAGPLWLALAGVGFMLELIADGLLPRQDRQPMLKGVWRAALVWPLLIPAAVETLLIHLGLAPRPPKVRLPEPPRGSELFTLPDDDLLVAVYQLLAGRAELTREERAVWLAESFSREIHGGGLFQWFCNTDSSVWDTVQALHTIGAPRAAGILQKAAEAAPETWRVGQSLEVRSVTLRPVEPAFRLLDADLFSPEHREELTSLIARFVRRNRSRCPALEDVQHESA